tara:strand:- start:8998 stop:9252 length:255 start_codon:yes stop_codon:yes gene_type:complete
MDQVKQIIHAVLTENRELRLNNTYECELAAELCEQALTKAVIHQVANLLGGNLEVDNDGNGIIYTNTNVSDVAQSLQYDLAGRS